MNITNYSARFQKLRKTKGHLTSLSNIISMIQNSSNSLTKLKVNIERKKQNSRNPIIRNQDYQSFSQNQDYQNRDNNENSNKDVNSDNKLKKITALSISNYTKMQKAIQKIHHINEYSNYNSNLEMNIKSCKPKQLSFQNTSENQINSNSALNQTYSQLTNLKYEFLDSTKLCHTISNHTTIRKNLHISKNTIQKLSDSDALKEGSQIENKIFSKLMPRNMSRETIDKNKEENSINLAKINLF